MFGQARKVSFGPFSQKDLGSVANSDSVSSQGLTELERIKRYGMHIGGNQSKNQLSEKLSGPIESSRLRNGIYVIDNEPFYLFKLAKLCETRFMAVDFYYRNGTPCDHLLIHDNRGREWLNTFMYGVAKEFNSLGGILPVYSTDIRRIVFALRPLGDVSVTLSYSRPENPQLIGEYVGLEAGNSADYSLENLTFTVSRTRR